MKRFALLLLCFLLTGCSYLGSTEDILISSPASLSIIRMETFDATPSASQALPHTPTTSASEQTAAPPASMPEAAPSSTALPETTQAVQNLILNTSGKTIHYYENCSYVSRMKAENRSEASAVMQDALIEQGYKVCSWCAKH